MTTKVGQAVSANPLMERYSASDLRVFSSEEADRYLDGVIADPRRNASLAWELLYRLEPDLYERLVAAEHLHPGIIAWLPPHVPRIIEVGAGTGRLTLELVARCDQLTAVEPAAPLRDRLRLKLAALPSPSGPGQANQSPSPSGGGQGGGVRIISGFFDALPVSDHSAELVIACSALTPEPAHGGDRGLAEMERVCAAGGMVVIVWPNQSEWLASHGYRYLSFPGPMTMDFASPAEAVQLVTIFYPDAAAEIRARGERQVPYDLLGVNPPRDLAYKHIL
jgi:SAM-dependent methyltransferase